MTEPLKGLYIEILDEFISHSTSVPFNVTIYIPNSSRCVICKVMYNIPMGQNLDWQLGINE